MNHLIRVYLGDVRELANKCLSLRCRYFEYCDQLIISGLGCQ